MEEEITHKDILEAIQTFSTNMDKRFDGVEGRLGGVENELKRLENKMDDGFASVRSEIAEVKRELLERINKLEKTDKEDTDATISDYLALKMRVEKLERQIQHLHPA